MLGGGLLVALLIGLWSYLGRSGDHNSSESSLAALGSGSVPRTNGQIQPLETHTTPAATKPATSEPTRVSAHKQLHDLILPQVVAWEKEHMKILRGLAFVKQAESVCNVRFPPPG
jgi:hypothetical protein